MFRCIGVVAISAILIFAASSSGLFWSNVLADKQKCEDIKYQGNKALKWDDQPDQHNEPSEKKFDSMIKNGASACEVSKCYDHNKCDGEITRAEYKEFKESVVYMGTSDEVDKCFDKRMDLGGELKAYELHHCQLGTY